MVVGLGTLSMLPRWSAFRERRHASRGIFGYQQGRILAGKYEKIERGNRSTARFHNTAVAQPGAFSSDNDWRLGTDSAILKARLGAMERSPGLLVLTLQRSLVVLQ